jgi:hypothetical protein
MKVFHGLNLCSPIDITTLAPAALSACPPSACILRVKDGQNAAWKPSRSLLGQGCHTLADVIETYYSVHMYDLAPKSIQRVADALAKGTLQWVEGLCVDHVTIRSRPDEPMVELLRHVQLGGKPVAEFEVAAARAWMSNSPGASGSVVLGGTQQMNLMLWRRVFHKSILPAHQSLCWLIHKGGVPVAVRLAKFVPGLSNLCPRCGKGVETITHRFVLCEMVNPLWKHLARKITGASVGTITTAPLNLLQQWRSAAWGSTQLAVTAACAIWAIHVAHTRTLQQGETILLEGLQKIFKSILAQQVMAKKATALVHNTLTSFQRRWRVVEELATC